MSFVQQDAHKIAIVCIVECCSMSSCIKVDCRCSSHVVSLLLMMVYFVVMHVSFGVSIIDV